MLYTVKAILTIRKIKIYECKKMNEKLTITINTVILLFMNQLLINVLYLIILITMKSGNFKENGIKKKEDSLVEPVISVK